MKLIFTLLLAGLALMTACQPTKQKETSAPPLDSLEQVFARATDPLDRIQLKRQISDLKMGAATPEERCRIFDEFAALVGEAIGVINQREMDYLARYFEYHSDYEGNEIPAPDSIKKKEQYYRERGVQPVHLGEGIVEFFPSPDLYTPLLRQLPDYYQEHWQLLRSSEHLTPDAGLRVSWRELGDLVARYEAYPKKFPRATEFFTRLSAEYQYLQHLYLIGVDNTPTFETADSTLLPEVRSEWLRFIKAYPDSPTAQIARGLLEMNTYDSYGTLHDFVVKKQKASDYPLLSTAREK
ncbi:hypothetical protein HMPREF1556_01198 [Porphyromonas sp. oral taxon 278 str. W7784]|uniref:hypothetical protein n=1 Tax=Porphyromonas sp. oral taxon 278 TaxID=712437 RepID=UPI0003AD0EE9|nr:hypothetical protein [Porphyromonas sp. oral taxon 278]ERJ71704.1 hypothetical protein HMPREF1556_01198 [Porphyromonas sp. oral taxon 278 str. W7784]